MKKFFISAIVGVWFVLLMAIWTIGMLPDFFTSSPELEDITLRGEDWIGFKSEQLQFKEIEERIAKLEISIKKDIDPIIACLKNRAKGPDKVLQVLVLAKESKGALYQLRKDVIHIKHQLKSVQRPKQKLNYEEYQIRYDELQVELRGLFIDTFPATLRVIRDTEHSISVTINEHESLNSSTG